MQLFLLSEAIFFFWREAERLQGGLLGGRRTETQRRFKARPVGAGTVGRIAAGDASDPFKMIPFWLPVKPGQREGPPAAPGGQLNEALHQGRAVAVTGGG